MAALNMVAPTMAALTVAALIMAALTLAALSMAAQTAAALAMAAPLLAMGQVISDVTGVILGGMLEVCVIAFSQCQQSD